MRAFIILSFLGFWSVSLWSQQSEAGIDIYGHSFSNSLSNRFTNSLLKSRDIDLAMKSSVTNRYLNNFYADAGMEIFFKTQKKEYLGIQNAGYKIAFRTRSFINSTYTADAFGLLFYGNVDYAGLTAVLDGSGIQHIQYQSLEYSFLKSYEGAAWNIDGAFSLALLKGQRYYHAQFDRASLFTEIDGSYLDADLKAHAVYSDSKQKFQNVNGLGSTIAFSLKAENKSSGSIIQISCTELGWLRWTKAASQTSIDTAFRYDGFAIDFQSDSLSGMSFGDTLQQLMNKYSRDFRGTLAIPGSFNFSFYRPVNEKIGFTAGLRYYFFTQMHFPYTQIAMHYQPTPKIKVSLLTAYGVYQNFQMGFSCDLQMAASWKLRIGLMNIIGILTPEHSKSQGLVLSTSYAF